METPEPKVVDFVESTEKTTEPIKEYYPIPSQFTTMGAMKLAKVYQSSPYESRTDVISKLRDRQNRDTVKEINNQFFASPTRRRITTLNSIEYPKKKSVKSKPGTNYVSPYSKQKLFAAVPPQQKENNKSLSFYEDLRYSPIPRRAKSPIKPYLVASHNDPFGKFFNNSKRSKSPNKGKNDLAEELYRKRSQSQQPGYF